MVTQQQPAKEEFTVKKQATRSVSNLPGTSFGPKDEDITRLLAKGTGLDQPKEITQETELGMRKVRAHEFSEAVQEAVQQSLEHEAQHVPSGEEAERKRLQEVKEAKERRAITAQAELLEKQAIGQEKAGKLVEAQAREVEQRIALTAKAAKELEQEKARARRSAAWERAKQIGHGFVTGGQHMGKAAPITPTKKKVPETPEQRRARLLKQLEKGRATRKAHKKGTLLGGKPKKKSTFLPFGATVTQKRLKK